MKKKTFLTLLFVSCYLLFVLACQNPFEPPQVQKPAVGGVGYVSLSIAGGGAHGGRTIMPAVTVDEDLFDGYTLVFSPDEGSPVTVERDYEHLSNAITLPVGTWDLVITAYVLDTDGTTKLPLADGSVTGIAITTGGTTSEVVDLKPIASDGAGFFTGTGTFSWDITLPADITNPSGYAFMTITDTAGGSAEQTLWLADESGDHTPLKDVSDTLPGLNAGVYKVTLTLSNGILTKTREEYLHVYRDMESEYTADFTGIFTVKLVTSENDSGDGSLRKAITDINPNGMIYITDSVKTITLASPLSIDKNLIIEGNGVTLKRNTSIATLRLLNISSQTAVVNISRINFEDGNDTFGGAINNYGTLTLESCAFSNNQSDFGGAIRNNGTLTLKSCIFSDNQATSYAWGGAICDGSSRGPLTIESCIFSGNQSDGSDGNGGAIYANGTTAIVKGCTFYQNSAATSGGAIYLLNGSLTLTGNLFYGNTANSNASVVSCYYAYPRITSGGYNVVDMVYGVGAANTNDKAGWTAETGANEDITINSLPISGKTFKLLKDTGSTIKIITTLPEGYPEKDFYDKPITNGGGMAAGAVQDSVEGSGYYIELSVNNLDAGTITPAPSATPDTDGLYDVGTTLLASPMDSSYEFQYWLINGTPAGNDNPLPITGHAKVQAVFAHIVTVNNSADTDNTPNTLRYALTPANLQDGDIIRITGVATIQLTKALPNISKTITIEGNGVTLKGGGSTSTLRLLNISSQTTVNISRINFEDGNDTFGGAINNYGTLTIESCTFSNNESDFGGAIRNDGTLTLKSCIFSDNQATSYALGGAIFHHSSSGPLTIESCIFNGNKSNGSNGSDGNGGAIYVNGTTAIVKGCTFYQNSAATSGGAIYLTNNGRLTLTGNLFYENTANSNASVVSCDIAYMITSGGYNVSDATLVTFSSGSYTPNADDKLLSALSISGDPFTDAANGNFKPDATTASALYFVPNGVGLPITDFNGVDRDWTTPSGKEAPGAVK